MTELHRRVQLSGVIAEGSCLCHVERLEVWSHSAAGVCLWSGGCGKAAWGGGMLWGSGAFLPVKGFYKHAAGQRASPGLCSAHWGFSIARKQVRDFFRGF